MKRFLAILLITVVVLVAAPAISSTPLDLIAHISAAAIAIPLPSYTIGEWCALRKYSRAEWYRMKARGDGPDTIGQGRMTRITPGADAKWLKAEERKAKQSKAAA